MLLGRRKRTDQRHSLVLVLDAVTVQTDVRDRQVARFQRLREEGDVPVSQRVESTPGMVSVDERVSEGTDWDGDGPPRSVSVEC